MYSLVKNNLSKALIAGFLGVMVVFPTTSYAATVQFQPRTNSEMLAFLYGRIAMLIEIQETLARGENVSNMSVDYVISETRGADEIEVSTAVLRGEVTLYGKASATVWFEYGQDEDFLDFRSNRTSVRSVYDSAVRTKVGYLEEDERYYFRLVSENSDKTITYGDIYQFRTDESE